MKNFNLACFFSLFIFSTQASDATIVATKLASDLVLFPSKSAPANVAALNHSLIPALTSAVVSKFKVRIGDVVQEEAVLAELDCQENKLLLGKQKALESQLLSQLEFEEAELARGMRLLKQKSIGQAELDRRALQVKRIGAQVLGQKQSVELARLNVSYCLVKAPFAGVVSQRLANLGEVTVKGQPLISLLEVNNSEIAAQLPLMDIANLRIAKSLTFVSEGESFLVNLFHVLPLISDKTRSQEVRFTFVDEQALPGSTGRVNWVSKQAHIPANLLLRRDGKSGFFIVKDNKSHFVEVKNVQEGRAIPFNLELSTLLIIDGRYGLVDGQTISAKSN